MLEQRQLCPKVDLIWNELASTGNAGALARLSAKRETTASRKWSVLRTLCGRGRPRSQY